MTQEQYPILSNDDNTPPLGQPRGIYDWAAERDGVINTSYTPHLKSEEGEPVVGNNEPLKPELVHGIIAESKKIAFPSPQVPTSGYDGSVAHELRRIKEVTPRARPLR